MSRRVTTVAALSRGAAAHRAASDRKGDRLAQRPRGAVASEWDRAAGAGAEEGLAGLILVGM